MVRSPGFGSCIRHQFALLRLAFTVASSAHGLNRATYNTLVGSFFNRNAVMVDALRRTTPTPCKRTISDTISSPSRAAFQLSITVLVHYRSGGVFSLATSSWLLPTRLLGPRSTLDLEQEEGTIFAYRTITVFGSTFQWIQLTVPALFVLFESHMFCPDNPFMTKAQTRPNACG